MADSLKNSAYVYDSIGNDAFDTTAVSFIDATVVGTLTTAVLTAGLANITTANITTLTTGSLPTLNVTGTANIFGLSSNTGVIDTLRVSNLYVIGSTSNVSQNILTSNSLNVYNYGTGPALQITQVTGVPDEAVALFTAINDHPALYINGRGTLLVNPPPGVTTQIYTDTELEVNGNIYVSSNSILSNIISNIATINIANITTLTSTGTPLFANLFVSNTVTTTNISATGISNLITANITNLTSTDTPIFNNLFVSNTVTTTNVSATGTSNLVTANISTLTSTGTPVFANLFVSNTVTTTNVSATGTSNLATANITTLTSTGTSNLATANIVTLTSTGTPVFANLFVSNTVTTTNVSATGTSNLVTANITTLTSTGTSNLVTANITTLTSTGTSNLATLISTGTSTLTNINTTNVQCTIAGIGPNTTPFRTSYPCAIGGALSDETTTLTAGTKLTIRAPYTFTVTSDYMPLFSLNANSASSNVTFSILKNGSNIYSVNPNVSFQSTFLSSNLTPGTLIGGSNTFNYLDKIDVTIVGIGSGTPNGAKVVIYCD